MGAEQCLSGEETLCCGAEHKSMPLFTEVPQVLTMSIANHCFFSEMYQSLTRKITQSLFLTDCSTEMQKQRDKQCSFN